MARVAHPVWPTYQPRPLVGHPQEKQRQSKEESSTSGSFLEHELELEY